jgi:hypothetical protein
MQSSNAPIELHSRISSSDVRKTDGKYHKWLKVKAAKKAAVHRRKRIGDVMSGAIALALRNNR